MPKTKKASSSHHKKRYGQHKKHSKSFSSIYWPYIPMLLMLFIVLVMGNSSTKVIGNVLGYGSDITESSLLSKTNEERKKQNLPELRINPELNYAAQQKGIDMQKKDYWSHLTPEGEQPWVFLESTDYNYIKAGENLAYGFPSSDATVNGWMQSQSHRENMLDSLYTEVGFGIVNAQNYLGNGPETIVVAFYAAPANETLGAFAGNPSQTFASSNPSSINFMQLTNGGNILPLLTSLLIGVSAGFLIARHSLRLKRLVTDGEHFIMHHPLLDLGLTAIIFVSTMLIQTAGFIG